MVITFGAVFLFHCRPSGLEKNLAYYNYCWTEVHRHVNRQSETFANATNFYMKTMHEHDGGYTVWIFSKTP